MLNFRLFPPTAALLAALSACVDSGTNCPRADTRAEERELRTVERLIGETRQSMARGYREEDAYGGVGVNFCLGGGGSDVGVAFCADPSRRTRAVPVDMAAEERKLQALTARRDALHAEIRAKSAACAGSGEV